MKLLARTLFLACALVISTQAADHPQGTAGNHYAEEAKELEAKLTTEGHQIKTEQSNLAAANKDMETLQAERAGYVSGHYPTEDMRNILLRDVDQRIAAKKQATSDLQKKLKSDQLQQARDLKQYRELQPKMGLYHVNNYDDFHKAEWVQPWYVPSGAEVGRWHHLFFDDTSAVISPIPVDEQTGYQEKARLMRTKNRDIYEAQPNSNNYISKIEVSEQWTMPIAGDEYINVTFKDGGEIRYKQPRDRMRADHDKWVRTYDWAVGSPHRPAAGLSAKDYPDALLLMRPKAEGDADKPDADLTYTSGWETSARATGVIGGFVLGIVGIGALFCTVVGNVILVLGMAIGSAVGITHNS